MDKLKEFLEKHVDEKKDDFVSHIGNGDIPEFTRPTSGFYFRIRQIQDHLFVICIVTGGGKFPKSKYFEEGRFYEGQTRENLRNRFKKAIKQ